MFTSANYLLSDLFVPDSSLNDDWSPADSDESSDDCEDDGTQEEEEECDSSPNITSVAMQSLCGDSRQNRCRDLVQLKPIKETVEERCIEALRFIQTVSTYVSCPLFQLEYVYQPSWHHT